MVATVLAEFGAEVIKVEQPGAGDPLRTWGDQKDGIGLFWKSVGRNKQCVTADLRSSDGQELFGRLLEVSDVLVINNRPSALAKWGLDYESVHPRCPRLVYLHVTGYGLGGPKSDRPGFGTLAEAMSGFAHVTGQPDGPPTLPPFFLADGVASQSAAAAVMMALYHRDVHGGGGQLIDVNLIDPLARLIETSTLTYQPPGHGDRPHRQPAPGQCAAQCLPDFGRSLGRHFECVAEHSAAPVPRHRSARVRRQPRVRRPAATPAPCGRARHDHRRLDSEPVPSSEVMDVFERLDVAGAPVYDAPQLMADEHLRARGSFVEVDDPDLGSMTVQAPVAHMSDTPGRVEHLGRDVGADNDAVYGGLLGLSAERLAALRAAGTI